MFRFEFYLWCVCVCVWDKSRVNTPNPPSSSSFSFLPWRLLTTDPSQLREEDLPGDLQSLSWLTSVDVPRLQQMADSRGHSNGPSQGGLLEQQTGEAAVRHSKSTSLLWLVWPQVQTKSNKKTLSPIDVKTMSHTFHLTAKPHLRLLSPFKPNTERWIQSYELCII